MPLTSSCMCGNAAAKFMYMRQCRWQVHVYAAMPMASSCICGNPAGKSPLKNSQIAAARFLLYSHMFLLPTLLIRWISSVAVVDGNAVSSALGAGVSSVSTRAGVSDGAAIGSGSSGSATSVGHHNPNFRGTRLSHYIHNAMYVYVHAQPTQR